MLILIESNIAGIFTKLKGFSEEVVGIAKEKGQFKSTNEYTVTKKGRRHSKPPGDKVITKMRREIDCIQKIYKENV